MFELHAALLLQFFRQPHFLKMYLVPHSLLLNFNRLHNKVSGKA